MPLPSFSHTQVHQLLQTPVPSCGPLVVDPGPDQTASLCAVYPSVCFATRPPLLPVLRLGSAAGVGAVIKIIIVSFKSRIIKSRSYYSASTPLSSSAVSRSRLSVCLLSFHSPDCRPSCVLVCLLSNVPAAATRTGNTGEEVIGQRLRQEGELQRWNSSRGLPINTTITD